MTSHLPIGRLGDYCEVDSGFAFKSERFSQNPEDINLVKGSNLGHRTIDWDEGPKWSKDEYEKLKFYELITDDVVLAMDRPIVGGNLKFAWMSESDPQALLVQRVARLRAKEGLDQIYLRYVIADSAFKLYIDTITTGANIPHISGPDIRDYKFPLPSVTTQNKIAAILSAYDDLIENNLKRIKLLEEMAQITYEEWFVRLKFPGHETTPLDSETGLPVGWEKSTLGNCCFLVMGQSPKSEFYNFEKEGLPFHQGVKDYGFRFPENTCWSTDGLRIAKAKDILFSVRAPVGRLNIAIEDIILGRGLSAIRHKQGSQSFLFYQLKQIFFQEDMIGGGAIYASVTKEDMLRIELIKPDEHTETKFNQFAAAIDQTIENLYRQNQLLKEARDILLPRLMTGMIDVDTVGADLSA